MRISVFAAAMLAGCASQPPIGAPDAMPQVATIATHAERGKSWMLPEAKSSDLLYVSSYQKFVNVYTYPKGKLGDVWIVDNQYARLYKYARGGTTPIATLDVPYGDPFSCAVDAKRGDLAVGTGSEQVLIYHHAQGTPIGYRDYPIEGFFYVAYDRVGNLYVSALTTNYKFQFAELPKGAKAFTNITLDQSITLPAGVVASGSDVAVGDQKTGTIFHFRISGSSGTEVGMTPLDGAGNALYQFAVNRGRVIAAVNDTSSNAAESFHYPSGGSAIKSISVQQPVGITISLAQNKLETR
jgi:hypothetical protein